jgi:transcriptional regulator with XRE-family HTH domain
MDTKLSANLHKLMRDNEITLRQLSRGSCIPISTLSSYLYKEKRYYTPQTLLQLSRFFGVSIDYLLCGSTATTYSDIKLGSFNGHLEIYVRKHEK